MSVDIDYRGGLVSGLPKVSQNVGKGTVFDVNSLYPSQMLNESCDWHDMTMVELMNEMKYIKKENRKLKRENETLRVDNALLYDQNDRLQMANRGIMVGVRRVVEGQLDLF